MPGLALVAVTLMIAGCSQDSSLRQQIRKNDFRNVARAEKQAANVPSPIADVIDMNGWTSDFDGATAFARVNERKTVVLFYTPGEKASERAKSTVSSVGGSAAGAMRVAVDASRQSDLAARYQVTQTPALVVISPTGNVASSSIGTVTKAKAVEALQ